jgi:hypothetical protein
MANASAILAVQEAIVTRLEADSTLQGLASFIGGYEPEIPITVHCISYYKGDLPALQMLRRVTELLSFYELTVSGYSTAICEYGDRMTKVLIETKGKVDRRHVHALFTIRVHE